MARKLVPTKTKAFFESLSWHHVDGEFNKYAIERLRDRSDPVRRRPYRLIEKFRPMAAYCFRNGFVQEGIARSD